MPPNRARDGRAKIGWQGGVGERRRPRRGPPRRAPRRRSAWRAFSRGAAGLDNDEVLRMLDNDEALGATVEGAIEALEEYEAAPAAAAAGSEHAKSRRRV